MRPIIQYKQIPCGNKVYMEKRRTLDYKQFSSFGKWSLNHIYKTKTSLSNNRHEFVINNLF